MKLYIASSVANAPFNQLLADTLRAGGFDVAVPHELCPPTIAHDRYSVEVFRACTDAMEQADAAVVNLDSCGVDSSWECGWFYGRKRPVIGVVHGTVRWLKDFMLKGCISSVVSSSALVADHVHKDAMIGDVQIKLIGSQQELPDAVRDLILQYRAVNTA